MKETFLDSQRRVMFIKELIQYQVIIKNQLVKINIEHNWESRNGKPGMFGLGMAPRETFWPFQPNFFFFFFDNKTCTWKCGHGHHWYILWSLPLLFLWLIFVSFFYFFFFFFFGFPFFIGLFPVTIDLVFTFLYHVTLEYGFWYGDSFLSVLFVNLCFPSQKKLAQIT